MSRTAAKSEFQHLPDTYEELVVMLPPRRIRGGVDLDNVTEMIRALAGFELNVAQADYLDALATFVKAYEDERYARNDTFETPLEALKAIMEEHDMSGSDLGRLLGNRTLGPAILSGNRGLSQAHIKTLAKHFSVRPALFL